MKDSNPFQMATSVSKRFFFFFKLCGLFPLYVPDIVIVENEHIQCLYDEVLQLTVASAKPSVPVEQRKTILELRIAH